MNHDAGLKEWLNRAALETGFAACGISRAEVLPDAGDRFRKWIEEGRNAGMQYLANNHAKRFDPRLLVEGTKSIISLIYPYYSSKTHHPDSFYRIARFARGNDYHTVLKEKMQVLVQEIERRTGAFSYRCFTDSAPVSEKSWAVRSGLGRTGKNSLLLHPKHGSYIFICEILCDLEIEPDTELQKDPCGTCTKCIDHCPTRAIYEAGKIDANRCLSYHTIEYKAPVDESLRPFLDGKIYGCDICQDVCPHNRNLSENPESWFQPDEALLNMTREDWLKLSPEEFSRLFRHSGIKRLGFEGLKNKIFSAET